MKRKILSLIFVLMLIPFASVFVACGKDEKVSLADLNTQFNAIADENKREIFTRKSYISCSKRISHGTNKSKSGRIHKLICGGQSRINAKDTKHNF